ncbi:hypothetical protein ACM43_09815 [Bradyrhizobium sp. CCBAU 45321]|nr:hypothetical protein [Bradyrhizobium sp. CCBAU 45321]
MVITGGPLMQGRCELREELRRREELKATLFRAQLDIAKCKAELAELDQRLLKNLVGNAELICW